MYGVTRRFAISAASKYEVLRCFSVGGTLSSNGAARPEISVPNYKPNPNETTEVKKARLLYQSRKRGMLENDLLLSTFADKHLEGMDAEVLSEYDSLINGPHSDWDIYYWVVGTKPTPPEFDNRVMALLKEHVQNREKEARYRQPDLPSRPDY